MAFQFEALSGKKSRGGDETYMDKLFQLCSVQAVQSEQDVTRESAPLRENLM